MKDLFARLVVPLLFGGLGVIVLTGLWQAVVSVLGIFRVTLPNRWTFRVFMAGWVLVAAGLGAALLGR